jgi:hypothetical protein
MVIGVVDLATCPKKRIVFVKKSIKLKDSSSEDFFQVFSNPSRGISLFAGRRRTEFPD